MTALSMVETGKELCRIMRVRVAIILILLTLPLVLISWTGDNEAHEASNNAFSLHKATELDLILQKKRVFYN